jgi:4-carboxymuconolactone decarboxylase
VNAQPPPRLAPVPRERWDDEVRAALAAGFPASVIERFFSDEPDAMRLPNALATFVNHPALAGPFLAFNAVLMNSTILPRRQRELMVLRVAWRSGSRYEWAQHVMLAPRYGITPEELEAIAEGASAQVWSALEKDLLIASDQLLDGYRINNETWARLAEQLDERQLMELVFTVGTYTTLAMAFNSFGLQLDPGLEVATTPPGPSEP